MFIINKEEINRLIEKWDNTGLLIGIKDEIEINQPAVILESEQFTPILDDVK